jgi:hypothetical protein
MKRIEILNSSDLMRKTIYLLITLLVVVPPAAAQTCHDAAKAAAPLLEDARVRIESSEPNEALALIHAAQTLLSACGGDSEAETPTAQGQSNETTALDSSGSTSTVALSPTMTSAVVTPPEVDLEQSIAFIAFANTSVDSGPIDLYSDQVTVPVVANLAFGEATGLVPFNGGPRTFIVRPAGSGADGDVLYSVAWDYPANSSWILTAAGLLDKLSFITEPVSIVRNEYNGRTRVRVVNLVPELRVWVHSENGAEFGNGLGWIGIKDTMTDAGSYILQVNTDSESLMESVSFEFDEETTHTFYVIGHPDSDYPVRLLPIITPQEITRVRFVSSRDDAVDIHYRPTNNRIVEGLARDETGAWIPLASGAVTFIAYAPGTGPTGRELASLSLQLRPGRDMTITLSAQEIAVIDVTLSSP